MPGLFDNLTAPSVATRKARGPLAQKLRDRPAEPHDQAANVLVCRGNLIIDEYGGLWHRDCPTPDAARFVRHAHTQESLT